MTTICLDFGNTRLKAAIFDRDQLKRVIVLNGDPLLHLKEIIEEYGPERSILSSVINHDPELEQLLRATTKFHKLSNESVLPISIPVGKPETVGADRLAIAAAAVFLFPGCNNLGIGLGT